MIISIRMRSEQEGNVFSLLICPRVYPFPLPLSQTGPEQGQGTSPTGEVSLTNPRSEWDPPENNGPLSLT